MSSSSPLGFWWYQAVFDVAYEALAQQRTNPQVLADFCVPFPSQEYIIHVDPVSQLGLNSDSVLGYSIGEIKRTNGAETPELLPCGYLVGENNTISVTIKGNFTRPACWSFHYWVLLELAGSRNFYCTAFFLFLPLIYFLLFSFDKVTTWVKCVISANFQPVALGIITHSTDLDLSCIRPHTTRDVVELFEQQSTFQMSQASKFY